jgi:hypothetical protein
VILIEGGDEFLENRITNLPEGVFEVTHWNAEGMKRRLRLYREENENVEGDPSVKDFFVSH